MRPSILLLLGWLLLAPPAASWHPPVHGRRAASAARVPVPADFGPATTVAPGVDLYRLDGPVLGRADAPQSVRLLRLEPRRVRLVSALATRDLPGRATVSAIASRTGALAAVNAGFFSPPGEPVGLLRTDGRLVSDTTRARGAVAVLDDGRGVRLRFGRATARVSLRFRHGSRWRVLSIDGVDTVRTPGQLVVYTPASGATTGTASGREWIIRPVGPSTSGLRASRATSGGNSAIPSDGYVLSRAGSDVPASLSRLHRASVVQVQESVEVDGQPRADWGRAPTIVGGAGLLVAGGRPVTEWTVERLSPGFETTRHPRTVIAQDGGGAVWLITVDGRQPGRASGMTFVELQQVLARLGATDALNLDGGGSTTMVVEGQVVNRPSDLTGPRPVSDAIVVLPR